jgi:uncharacterized damage-inducible protein DinB
VSTDNSQIELLKWMLEDIRKETLKGVEHLSKEQLFKNPIEDEYPIGAYLMHLAEVDISWLEIISGVKQPDDLKKKSYYDKWYDAPENSEPPRMPLEVNEYLETIAAARKNFLDYVSSLKESDLEEVIVWKGARGERKFSRKWIIYHILEHEAHHRGQMFLLIRKAGWNKK